MDLLSLLLWQNVLFCIPLFFGIVLILGMMFGLSDTGADAEIDVDADVDADTDVEHHHGLASILGFGRCPTIIVLMTMNLVFGGVGLGMNSVFVPILGVTLGFTASLVSATIAMFVATGLIARAVSAIMPSTETTSVRASNLVGATGIVLLEVTHREVGLVQVVKGGDVYNLDVISDSGRLDKGSKVLLIDYDENSDVYFACAAPPL